jgi:hypothetical protein
VCQKYTTCVMSEPWDHRTPFETQVRDVASAGIFVGVHGAGMTNQMFLPPNGAVIELFPFRWWPDMYRRLVRDSPSNALTSPPSITVGSQCVVAHDCRSTGQ